jgi:hypothetical protein
MAGERLTIDPIGEDLVTPNSPLELAGQDPSTGIYLLEHAYPQPEQDVTRTSSSDTEGDPTVNHRPRNREITLKLRVLEPADGAATNLIVNPSFELDTSTWVGQNGATLARAATGALIGDACLQIMPTSANFSQGLGGAASWNNGDSLVGAMWVKSTVGTTLRVFTQSAGGTAFSTTVTATGDWQRVTVTGSAADTAVGTGQMGVDHAATGSTALMFVDGVQLHVTSEAVPNYFDGDSPGCSWTGVRHGSTSKRPATGGPRFEAILGDLQRKVDRCNRESNTQLPQPTLRRVSPNGTPITFDLVGGDIDLPTDRAIINLRRATVTLKFEARPYGRGAEQTPSITDDFSTDGIASGVYAFDLGAGTLTVTGGQLAPTSTAQKQMYRAGATYGDAQQTMKFTTGASVAGSQEVGLIAQRLDTINHLIGRVIVNGATSNLQVVKNDGGTLTTLAGSANFTLATATTYWLRVRDEGNLVTVELWTSAPTPTGTPAQSVAFTLTGADAAKYGLAAVGNVGIWLKSLAGTDYRFDDYTIEPRLFTETAKPCLIIDLANIKGDVPALGRFVIQDYQNQDQWWMVWGLQQRHRDSSVDAALFYEAEGRNALNGAVVAAGTAPVSGSGNNVMRSAALTTTYAGVVSTQATGGGNHLRHVGDFRVFARVFVPTSATGVVKVALDWAEGDFRRHTQNTEVTPGAPKGTWALVDLGQVHLTRVLAGTQRWEGRVLAKSTVAGDTVDVDCLIFIPVTEGSGQGQGIQQVETPTTFLARDEFDQTAGALAGKTAPVGGVWAGAGHATDFTVDAASHTAQRTTTSDGGTQINSGRVDVHGAAAFAAQIVQAEVLWSAILTTGTQYTGIVARYVDINNFFALVFQNGGTIGSFSHVFVIKVVGGTQTTIGQIACSFPTTGTNPLRLTIDAAGRWFAYAGTQAPISLVASGQDPVLATGGALASGKGGIVDWNPSAQALTRSVDNFFAAPATQDATMFAGRQVELRSDRIRRQDSTGALWTDPSKYEGDYLRIPPAGREGRTSRIIVKAARNDPASAADAGIDDISARLYYTPRYLVVPDL